MPKKEERLREFRDNIAKQRSPLPRPERWENLVLHSDDVLWYKPEGTNPSMMGPVLDIPIKTFELFLQEIAPGGTSDMQQHHHEAVHFIISGQGYSELGEGSYSWAEGDFISVPPMVWHRHYNSSTTEPVKMLLIENSKLLEFLGLNLRVSAGFVNYTELKEKLDILPFTDGH